MAGGRFSHPVRRGAVVERAAAVPNVRALPRHFERVGFTLAPRVVGSAEGGVREVLSFIERRATHYPLTDLGRH